MQPKISGACLRIQRTPCPTCIYGPNWSGRSVEALEAEIADPKFAGYFLGYRICHHSDDVCCAGFWARHRDHFTGGQLAQRLGLVEVVEVDIRREED